MKRVILMCAGRGLRWKNHLGIPKHLIAIGGEGLLDRTVRLIRAHSPADIFIAGPANDERYRLPQTTLFVPPPDACLDTDKFLCGVDHWAREDQTILLYGDVYFTEPAMKTILNFAGEASFFGRPHPSRHTGHAWAEMFALSFAPSAHTPMRDAMIDVRQQLAKHDIERGGGWEVYRRAQRLDPVCIVSPQQEVQGGFVKIDDFTDDFDSPEDHIEWTRRFEAHRKRQAGSMWRSSFT